MAVKMPTKSFRWKGSSLASALRARLHVLGQNHLPHGGDAIFLEEHVLGAAQADSLGAEIASSLGVLRRVGIGANLQLAVLVGPLHDLGKIARQLRRHGRHGSRP